MTEAWRQIEIDSESALWDWLEAHHESVESYLLVTWKKADKTRYVSRDQVLDALLAYGWIDGRRYVLDEARTMQLICQRQQQKWTKSYRARVAKLTAAGRMKPAGQAVVTAAQQTGHWLADEDVDNLDLPADLKAALAAQNGLDWWHAAAPSYQRNILRWLKTAKRQETRIKRCAIIANACAKGQKIPNY